jgi:prephenate dehydrogenase
VKLPLAENVIVTDVGSVKACVVAGAGEIFENAGISFVGSHPMAGSEEKGFDASFPGMFNGAACILTPTQNSKSDDVSRVRRFWESLGSRVSEMDATKHDQTVAGISHMPHLAATAVTLAALEMDPAVARFAAGGLRDTTRVASGDPDMWREILMENREAVLASGRQLERKLHELLEFIEKIEDQPLRAALAKAKTLRDARYHPPG